MFSSLVDRTLEPGAVTADVLSDLLHQNPSKDDYRIGYSMERLRAPWKVAHHWNKWDRMEHEVGNLKEALLSRFKPPILPSRPSHQEGQEQDQPAFEKDNQANEVEESTNLICSQSSCFNLTLPFSFHFLSWTVSKLIGHQNVNNTILDEIKLLGKITVNFNMKSQPLHNLFLPLKF